MACTFRSWENRLVSACARLLAFGGVLHAFLVVAESPAAAPLERALPAPCVAPDGFQVALAAGPPLVHRPLFAAFGDDGELYVVDSGGINDDDHRAQNPPDVVRRLTDDDGDGLFDRSSVFADKINFGTGIVWYDGALFLTSPPSLWRLRDVDGDGRADERTELVTGFAFNGSCSDDAHGACLGPDGRIYFLAGRFPHEIRDANGRLIRQGVGPWVLRCRPDGGEAEVVSGCVGNGVEVAFLPSGDMFAQGTYWAKPSMGGGLRDALIHVAAGAEYSVRDRDYTDRIRTGDLLPVLAPMSNTSPSGCMIYSSRVFGAEYQHDLFGSYFTTGRILRYRLERSGATFAARPEEFLVGKHQDVHFTDVLEDADGSLLAVDTGGWFRRCCPTSKIAKPEIFGGIYRVRRIDAVAPRDPRGAQWNWHASTVSQLIDLLDDDRPAVRERAIERLRLANTSAVEALARVLASSTGKNGEQSTSDERSEKVPSVRQRQGAIWALCRMNAPGADAAVKEALGDVEADVRLAAVSATALHRNQDALQNLRQIAAADASLAVRREAANALGRIGDSAAVPVLLNLLAEDHAATMPASGSKDQANQRKPPESSGASAAFLDHAAILALIEIGDADQTRDGLTRSDARIQRGALIALDQMPNGRLAVDEVTPLVASDYAPLQKAAVAILIKHSEWSTPVAQLFDEWLLSNEPWTAERRATLGEMLITFREAPEMQQQVDKRLHDVQPLSVDSLRELLAAVGGCRLNEAPQGWRRALTKLTSHDDESIYLASLRAIESLRLTEAAEAVRESLARSTRSPMTQIAALRCLAILRQSLGQSFSGRDFDTLLTHLNPATPTPQRLAAMEILATVRAEPQQLLLLIDHVAAAGPIEMPHLLRAFAGCDDEGVGKALVGALESSSTPISVDLLEEILQSYPVATRELAAALAEKGRAAAERQAQRLAELHETLARTPGSAERGRALFFQDANCYLCHQVQGEGGKIGPDLTSISASRSQGDLLEAVLAPSASFARGFEPVSVLLHDGRTVSGLMGRETPNEIVLNGVQENKPIEIRVARDEIESVVLGRVSLMPEGLERQLSRQQLCDLFAYLSSLRASGEHRASSF